MSASCAALVDVAEALDIVGSSEGELVGTEVNYAMAAEAFEGTPPPKDLTDEWASATEGLRYYERSVSQPDRTPHRSEADRREWQMAFGRITHYAIGECDSGWRTMFDDCREGEPPAGAHEIRLILPCWH